MSLFGFMILAVILNQILSGILLSFSLITEPMFIPLVREEEDCENMYIDDFFWLHERGVDLLVIFTFLHLFRKLYLNVADSEQEYAWKSGVILFLLIQVVIFLGLVLCCTHLSEITLTIATNAFHSFCLFIGKLYWLLFTDQSLNSDTLTRMAYLHYILALILAYYGVLHGVEMHYDWKNEEAFDGQYQELSWFGEALSSELGQTVEWMVAIGGVCLLLYAEPEALSYEIFMWGDIGMVGDVRFYGVAPHWYFRPYMGWLILCPYHYTGLLGLLFFFISFYFQPNIIARTLLDSYLIQKVFLFISYISEYLRDKGYVRLENLTVDLDIFYKFTYFLFLMSLWYAFSYLPFGRFFNRIGGNLASTLAYVYLYLYTSGLYLRLNVLYNLFLAYRRLN